MAKSKWEQNMENWFPLIINLIGPVGGVTLKSVEFVYAFNGMTQLLQFYFLREKGFKFDTPQWCQGNRSGEGSALINSNGSGSDSDINSSAQSEETVSTGIWLQHAMGTFVVPTLATWLIVSSTPGQTQEDENKLTVWSQSIFYALNGGSVFKGVGLKIKNDQISKNKAQNGNEHLYETLGNSILSFFGLIALSLSEPNNPVADTDKISLHERYREEINGTITWYLQALLFSSQHQEGRLFFDGVGVNLTQGIASNFSVPCGPNESYLPENIVFAVNGTNISDVDVEKSWDFPLDCWAPTEPPTEPPTTTTSSSTTTSAPTEPPTEPPTPGPGSCYLWANLGAMAFTGNGDFEMLVTGSTNCSNPPWDQTVHFIGHSNNGLVPPLDQSLSWEQILSNQSYLTSHCYLIGDSQIAFNPIDGVSITNPYYVRCAEPSSSPDALGAVNHLNHHSSPEVVTPIAVVGGFVVVLMALKCMVKWFGSSDHEEIKEYREDAHRLGGSFCV